MADQLPVFVLVTVDVCGPCKGFKKDYWDSLRKTLEDSKSVRIKHINLAGFDSPLPADVPADIKRFIPHYPSFILVSADSWNRKGSLDAVVFNMEKNAEGKLVSVAPEKRMKYSEIPKWVSDNITALKRPTEMVKLVDDRKPIHRPTDGQVFKVPTYCSNKFVGNE